MNFNFKHLLSLLLLILFLIIAGGSDESIVSNAKGVPSDFKIFNDAGVINNQLDAGYTISFTVKNTGQEGVITINAKLSCSEGEWTRSQTVNFKPNESNNFSYFFHEPTINATNVHGSVNVIP